MEFELFRIVVGVLAFGILTLAGWSAGVLGDKLHDRKMERWREKYRTANEEPRE